MVFECESLELFDDPVDLWVFSHIEASSCACGAWCVWEARWIHLDVLSWTFNDLGIGVALVDGWRAWMALWHLLLYLKSIAEQLLLLLNVNGRLITQSGVVVASRLDRCQSVWAWLVPSCDRGAPLATDLHLHLWHWWVSTEGNTSWIWCDCAAVTLDWKVGLCW